MTVFFFLSTSRAHYVVQILTDVIKDVQAFRAALSLTVAAAAYMNYALDFDCASARKRQFVRAMLHLWVRMYQSVKAG